MKRLKKFKKTRNIKTVKSNLNSLKIAINKNINLMPYIINCVKNNCTLGEICDVMKKIYGEHV